MQTNEELCSIFQQFIRQKAEKYLSSEFDIISSLDNDGTSSSLNYDPHHLIRRAGVITIYLKWQVAGVSVSYIICHQIKFEFGPSIQVTVTDESMIDPDVYWENIDDITTGKEQSYSLEDPLLLDKLEQIIKNYAS